MNSIVAKHARSSEFLAAARYLATRHLSGKRGDPPLPLNMSADTVQEINSNLHLFQMFVSMAHKNIYGY